ncbi:MAG: mycothiol conjugate amidase Mca [Propionibacteriaceae bacterium]|jgi:mycothiol S-conjugate amidase|nr:mycothiol conjugate amidase Mca [Propionibacteriaceae bacterium]
MSDLGGLRLLHVHAHPDDESSKGAATTAYYVAQGVQVMVATCTGGESGSILNKEVDTPENWARLPELRRAEMAEAARILQIHQRWLGFKDSGYPGDPGWELAPDAFAAQDVGVAAARLVGVIREFQPQVVTCYTPDGGYPHPDHIMAHKVTVAALPLAADPAYHPELGAAWQVSKLYYDRSFSMAKLVALDNAMRAWGMPSKLDERITRRAEPTGPDYTITTAIPCGGFFEVRNAALLAHRTQIDPDDAWWFGVPPEVERDAWPTEDYHLACSTVETQLPESDLFAGLRHTG